MPRLTRTCCACGTTRGIAEMRLSYTLDGRRIPDTWECVSFVACYEAWIQNNPLTDQDKPATLDTSAKQQEAPNGT